MALQTTGFDYANTVFGLSVVPQSSTSTVRLHKNQKDPHTRLQRSFPKPFEGYPVEHTVTGISVKAH